MKRWLTCAAAAAVCLGILAAAGFAIGQHLRAQARPLTPVYGAIFVSSVGGAHEFLA